MMDPEEMQTKLFQLGELLGGALVADQYGNTGEAERLRNVACVIIAQLAELDAHISIWYEKQFLRKDGFYNKGQAEKLVTQCHGGKIYVWMHIAIILDGTQGHVVSRLGDINTDFDLDYEADECNDDNGIAGDDDPDTGKAEPRNDFNEDDFFRQHGIKPPE